MVVYNTGLWLDCQLFFIGRLTSPESLGLLGVCVVNGVVVVGWVLGVCQGLVWLGGCGWWIFILLYF